MARVACSVRVLPKPKSSQPMTADRDTVAQMGGGCLAILSLPVFPKLYLLVLADSTVGCVGRWREHSRCDQL